MAEVDAERVATNIIEQAWNQGHVEVLDRYVAPNYRRRGSTVIDGREAWKEWIVAVRTAFPDFHVEIHDVITSEDRAAVRFTASATHSSPYLGFDPTGEKFSADGMVMVRYEGGLLVEEWEVVDRLALFNQLQSATTADTPINR